MSDKKYIDNLTTPTQGRGGVVRINEHTKCMLIEGASKVEFSSLYPNLLVKLYRGGVLQKLGVDTINPSLIQKVEYFLNNRRSIKLSAGTGVGSATTYVKYKTWINSLYMKELRKETHLLFEIYHQYMSQYYDDIQSLNKYTWLHTNVDVMHFAGSDVVMPTDIGLPFTTDKIDLVYVEARNKYVEYSNNDLKIKGYSSKRRPEDIISLMKQKIRESKIDNILD